MTKRSIGLLSLILAAGCGGSDDEDDDGAPAVTCAAGASVSIGTGGATPGCVRADEGASVTISNARAAAVEIRSAPHPTHGSCPEIDALAPIPAGASVTVVMRTAGTCEFHDHATGAVLGAIQVGGGTPDRDYSDRDY